MISDRWTAPGQTPGAVKPPALKIFLSSILLTGLVWAIYGQAIGFARINVDDPLYLPEDGRLALGFSRENLRWIFSVTESRPVFAPVALGSFLLEAALFGDRTAVFHGTNVTLHALNAVLLLGLLWRMTHHLRASLLVAALFAAHPLRVESVAWLTERKDVLGMFFGLLSLHAYVRYCASPASRWYLAALTGQLLSLGCKPMFVTLPLLLLILDYWPLRRWHPGVRYAGRRAVAQPDSAAPGWQKLVLEKLPFGLASLAIAVATILSHQAHVGIVHQPLSHRLGNALVSYQQYLIDTVCPTQLALYYPFPAEGHSRLLLAAAFCTLTAVSILAVCWRQRHPYLLAGWLWFVVSLAPMIGVIQAGNFGRADRFTYLAHIGLLTGAGWLALGVFRGRWPRLRLAAAAGMLLALALLAHRQVGFWKDSVTLFRRTVQVTRENAAAHSLLGSALTLAALENGAATAESKLTWSLPGQLNQCASAERFVAAAAHCRTAVRLEPKRAEHRLRLGIVLLLQNHLDEAEQQLEAAVQLDPRSPAARNNLGLVQRHQEEFAAALEQFQVANRLAPSDPAISRNLSEMHIRVGLSHEARRQWATALRHFAAAKTLTPSNADAFYHTGRIKLEIGHRHDALVDLRQALRIDPTLHAARLAIIRTRSAASPTPLRRADRPAPRPRR